MIEFPIPLIFYLFSLLPLFIGIYIFRVWYEERDLFHIPFFVFNFVLVIVVILIGLGFAGFIKLV